MRFPVGFPARFPDGFPVRVPVRFSCSCEGFLCGGFLFLLSGPDSPGSPSQDEMVPEPEPVPKNTPDQFDTHQKLGQIAGTIALLMLTLTLKFKT